jgi:hypothetical protein
MSSTPEASGEAKVKHELKTWQPFFAAVLDGRKPFEVRKDDRGFRVGDTLLLQEWDALNRVYTGRTCERTISYLFRGGDVAGFGVEYGYVVLGLHNGGKTND